MKTQMKKPPPDIPIRMQYCCLRADAQKWGVLIKFDPETEWATVEWLSPVKGPKFVHRYELRHMETVDGVVHGCVPYPVTRAQIETALKAQPKPD